MAGNPLNAFNSIDSRLNLMLLIIDFDVKFQK